MNKYNWALSLLSFLLVFPPDLSAAPSKPNLQVEQVLRHDIQQKEKENLVYTGRTDLVFPIPKETGLNQVSLFYEARWNPQQSDVEQRRFREARHNFQSDSVLRSLYRQQIGLELSYFFLPSLRLREAIQQVFRSPGKNAPELLSRLQVDIPLLAGRWGIKLYGWEEYTYDIDLGEATLNEVGGGFRLPLKKQMLFSLGWRHTDRIHDLDSDSAEIGLQLQF